MKHSIPNILAAVACAAVCAAQNVPFSYQGHLKVDDSPASAEYDLKFQLFDSASGGTSLGTVDIDDKLVTNGLFSVELAFSTNAFNGSDRWLQIEVRPGSSNGTYTILTPRSKINPTPYAFLAQKIPWSGISDVPAGFADGVDDNTSYTAGAGVNLTGTTFSIAPGGVSSSMLGDQSVTFAKLHIAGAGEGQALTFRDSNVKWENPVASGMLLPFSAAAADEDNPLIRIHNTAASGNAYAYYGETDSEFGSAIYGVASNGGIGLEGVAQGSGGSGVFGRASGLSGRGVYAESAGASGAGVYSVATSPSGDAVGVYAQSHSANGVGVQALASATNGTNVAVSAQAMGHKGIAVSAKATSLTGATYGVWAQSDSTEGIGIYGLAKSTSGFAIGIQGETKSPDGIGIVGTASAAAGGVGVFGFAASPNGIGVSGTAASGGVGYGVAGTSGSTHSNATGVFAEGAGAASPGAPQAAALQINNGAIRVSGAKRPAGTILVPTGEMNPLISCVTPCPTCDHTHVTGWYQDFPLQNDLIVSDSVILATVETVTAPLRVSYYVQVFDKAAGSASLRVTAMGSNNSECAQPVDGMKVHYQIINPFPPGE